VEEINMYKDMPAHYVHELLTEILWPAHPLGFPLAGTVESVNGLTRSGIMEYKETYYTPSNMVVMACGNLKDAKIVKICERYFSKGFKKTAPQAHPAPRRPAPKPSTLVRYKKTEQTHLAIGLHASSRFHPDRYVLSLLNVVLGANMSSRLFQEARERRALCYEIGSSIRRYRDAGAFIIGAGVDCAKLPKALEVIFNELRKLKVRPVPKDELERAKEFYKGQLHLTIEETMSAMLWFGEKVSSGERDLDVKGILAKVDSISAQDLMKTASETFRDTNLNVAVIGPIEDEERVEEVSHIR
jgi:predicted Zn-dependent peptidase